MQYPLNELIDRVTIERLKSERTAEDRVAILATYTTSLEERIKTLALDETEVQTFIAELYDINGQMWDTEGEIRAALEAELGLEEVGRRAIKVRDLNRIRVGIKNTIAQRYGDGFLDIRVNYGSPDVQ